jgi:hypothetical protein
MYRFLGDGSPDDLLSGDWIIRRIYFWRDGRTQWDFGNENIRGLAVETVANPPD